jgi:GntR family transcriptional repressor for pyruvate dehydrogenase complex
MSSNGASSGPSTIGAADGASNGAGGGGVALAAPVFEPVTRETLSAQIRDQLLERIRSGELEPGSRVPSERDLSDQFRVARTSVREAMQGLLSLGVIERRGNRSFVAERLPEVSFGDLDNRKEFVRQLFETRRALELPIIELAATRADEGQRGDIARIADRFRPGMPLSEFRELDQQFHAAIARACRNPLLIELYNKVLSRLFESHSVESMLSDGVNRAEVDRIVAESVQHHATIAHAIAAADPEAAVAEGTRHLRSVEQGMIDRLV